MISSNSSGSKEAPTTTHFRGRTSTAGTGHDHLVTAPLKDRFKDLVALIIEPRNHDKSFEHVIDKSSSDKPNPSLANMLAVSLRLVALVYHVFNDKKKK